LGRARQNQRITALSSIFNRALITATKPKDFGLRFFYFAFACLLYSIWRAVDLLVQVELTGDYQHSPMVTEDNTLTLVKKEAGTG
jgi:IS4 transposase